MLSANNELNKNKTLGSENHDNQSTEDEPNHATALQVLEMETETSTEEPEDFKLKEYFQILRSEFTYDKLWRNRTWSDIGKHFALSLGTALIPSTYDTVTDSLLCYDFWFGKDYMKTVQDQDDPSVNMTECRMVGFYTEVSNKTNEVITYDFACFQKDPFYAVATLVFLLLPSTLTFQALPIRKNCANGCALFLSLIVPFPVLLLAVKTVGLINPGENWQTLAAALTQCEGFFESSCQAVLQLYILFTRADRQPSTLQILTISASFLLLTKTSITSLLQPRHNKPQLTTKEKLIKAVSVLPMVLTNSVFKLFTLAVVFSVLRLMVVCVVLPIQLIMMIMCLLGKFEFDIPLMELSFQNLFGISCLSAKFTDTQQRKQLSIWNTFLFIIHTLLLTAILLLVNIAPDTDLGFLPLSTLPIVQDIRMLNTIVVSAWISGLISNILIHFQG